MRVPVLQRSRSWAEKASKGAGFALTNMKRKDDPSPEPVTFTLNFRQAQHPTLASALPVQLLLNSALPYCCTPIPSALAQLIGDVELVCISHADSSLHLYCGYFRRYFSRRGCCKDSSALNV